MKKVFFIGICTILCIGLYAQNTGVKSPKGKITKYETFIYSNDELNLLIQREYGETQRSLLDDMLHATLNAGKGIAGGYVTAFLDMGVNAVGMLITKNAVNKQKWEEAIKAENVYQETITSVSGVKDFYSSPSEAGALDPKGMIFDGIGCLRKIGNDTVFYVSFRVDKSKIYRIINHSKFELVLDELIINPYYCNLPNSKIDTTFSFDRRKNLRIALDMKLSSSWMNLATTLHSDQVLGQFSLVIPVSPNDLDKKGVLRYVRPQGEASKYQVSGESFIVPRSVMGYRYFDQASNEEQYKEIWGTGEYKLEITLKENCDVTDNYRNNWKADWKHRKAMSKKGNFIDQTWEVITGQRWDELSKQMVVTTLKAPAGVLNKELLEELKLNVPPSATTKPAATGGSGGAGGSSGSGAGSGGSGKPK